MRESFLALKADEQLEIYQVFSQRLGRVQWMSFLLSALTGKRRR